MSTLFSNIPEIADEYVLGLLNVDEAFIIESAIKHDEELKHAVAQSRERLLPLDTSVEPLGVTEKNWRSIEQRLPYEPSTSAASFWNANDNLTNVSRWRFAALIGAAASFLLAVGLGWSITQTTEPVVIAVLLDDKGSVQAVVEDFGNENATVRLLNTIEVPPGKAIEVWTLPSPESGPISMGLLDGTQSAHLRSPDLPLPRSEQLYELTLEPAGGSPIGRPTGPILSKGYAKIPL